MTSPLLNVLTWREEIHWVLTSLLFIRGLWHHLIQWVRWNVRANLKQLEGLGYSHLSLLHWDLAYLLLIWGFYLALVSARHVVWSILSSPGVMIQTLWILRFCKTPILRTWWKSIISSFHPRSGPDSGNPRGPQSYLVRGFFKKLSDLLRGFTRAIYVIAQLYPPYYPSLINYFTFK